MTTNNDKNGDNNNYGSDKNASSLNKAIVIIIW